MEWPRDLVMIISVQISSTATAQEEISNSYISELRISFSDHSVIIGLDANGMFTRLHVNTNDLSAFTKNYSTIRRSILPYILDKPGDEYIISAQGYFTAFTNAIVEELQKYLPRSVATYTIRAIAGGMTLGSSSEVLHSLQATSHVSKQSLNRISNWTTNSASFRLIQDLFIARSVLMMMPSLEKYVGDFAQKIEYMAPVRVATERFNRVQNLTANNVDFRGQNLAMFLRGLSPSERDSFSEWTREYLGFATKAKANGEHIAITLEEVGSKIDFNIADMGFGYSQMLPIITRLWTLNNRVGWFRTFSDAPRVFAIEQPELHLHPRLQARLADTFWATVETASANEVDLRLIIETHSEAIVNRLGHLVAKKRIPSNLINVVLFHKGPSDAMTKVRISNYDQNGILTDWPYGFFEPDEE